MVFPHIHKCLHNVRRALFQLDTRMYTCWLIFLPIVTLFAFSNSLSLFCRSKYLQFVSYTFIVLGRFRLSPYLFVCRVLQVLKINSINQNWIIQFVILDGSSITQKRIICDNWKSKVFFTLIPFWLQLT